jgi:hypothetical protein
VISDWRDSDRARRRLEQLPGVIRDEVAIDVVLAARGDDQQVGIASARQVVQTSPRARRLDAHHLRIELRLVA